MPPTSSRNKPSEDAQAAETAVQDSDVSVDDGAAVSQVISEIGNDESAPVDKAEPAILKSKNGTYTEVPSARLSKEQVAALNGKRS